MAGKYRSQCHNLDEVENKLDYIIYMMRLILNGKGASIRQSALDTNKLDRKIDSIDSTIQSIRGHLGSFNEPVKENYTPKTVYKNNYKGENLKLQSKLDKGKCEVSRIQPIRKKEKELIKDKEFENKKRRYSTPSKIPVLKPVFRKHLNSTVASGNPSSVPDHSAKVKNNRFCLTSFRSPIKMTSSPKHDRSNNAISSKRFIKTPGEEMSNFPSPSENKVKTNDFIRKNNAKSSVSPGMFSPPKLNKSDKITPPSTLNYDTEMQPRSVKITERQQHFPIYLENKYESSSSPKVTSTCQENVSKEHTNIDTHTYWESGSPISVKSVILQGNSEIWMQSKNRTLLKVDQETQTGLTKVNSWHTISESNCSIPQLKVAEIVCDSTTPGEPTRNCDFQKDFISTCKPPITNDDPLGKKEIIKKEEPFEEVMIMLKELKFSSNTNFDTMTEEVKRKMELILDHVSNQNERNKFIFKYFYPLFMELCALLNSSPSSVILSPFYSASFFNMVKMFSFRAPSKEEEIKSWLSENVPPGRDRILYNLTRYAHFKITRRYQACGIISSITEYDSFDTAPSPSRSYSVETPLPSSYPPKSYQPNRSRQTPQPLSHSPKPSFQPGLSNASLPRNPSAKHLPPLRSSSSLGNIVDHRMHKMRDNHRKISHVQTNNLARESFNISESLPGLHRDSLNRSDEPDVVFNDFSSNKIIGVPCKQIPIEKLCRSSNTLFKNSTSIMNAIPLENSTQEVSNSEISSSTCYKYGIIIPQGRSKIPRYVSSGSDVVIIPNRSMYESMFRSPRRHKYNRLYKVSEVSELR